MSNLLSGLLVDCFRMSEINSVCIITFSVSAILAGIYCYKNTYDFDTMFKCATHSFWFGTLIGILGRVSHLF